MRLTAFSFLLAVMSLTPWDGSSVSAQQYSATPAHLPATETQSPAGSQVALTSYAAKSNTCDLCCPNICCSDDTGYSQCGDAGYCFAWGEDTWLKVGAGIRASYRAIEGFNPANGATAQDFNLDNTRVYLNGQGHPNIGFEFNMDVNNAQGFDDIDPALVFGSPFGSFESGNMRVLDAILKFKLTDNIQLWMGRLLPPSDRSNLDGPFYLNAWLFPYVQFGYSNIFQGRDDGVALWGEHGGGRFKWQVGLFEGENTGAPFTAGHPATDNLMFAGRVVLNLLDPEPGYYNQSTYYGEKDILALGASMMHRHDALADFVGPGQADYTAWSLDFLFERKLANEGVATLEAAYYDFDDSDGVNPVTGLPVLNPTFFGNFATRQGESYFVLGSYLFPGSVSFGCLDGRIQVMGRYQQYDHDTVGFVPGGVDDQVDFQVNYIMFGHNARLSFVWTQYDPFAGANNLDAFIVGGQVQF